MNCWWSELQHIFYEIGSRFDLVVCTSLMTSEIISWTQLNFSIVTSDIIRYHRIRFQTQDTRGHWASQEIVGHRRKSFEITWDHMESSDIIELERLGNHLEFPDRWKSLKSIGDARKSFEIIRNHCNIIVQRWNILTKHLESGRAAEGHF